MIRVRNTLFGTQPIVMHCPGPLCENWTFLEEAVAGAAVGSRPMRESATVITWNNGAPAPKPGGVMERSLARFGCTALVLGQGVVPWSNQKKLHQSAQALRHVRTDYVIGLDSSDVLLLDHPDEIVARYRRHFTCDLLFNATGAHCWPEYANLILFERSLPGAKRSQGRCWLNSGCFVGRTEFCRDYFAALAEQSDREHLWDDQLAIKQTWPQWYPRVQIDDRCEIFQWFNEERRVTPIERPRVDRQIQLVEWLRAIEPLRFGVEVGVYEGATSAALLHAFPELVLWMVDRWLPVTGPDILSQVSADGFERALRQAWFWTSHAAERRHVLRMPSVEAAGQFPAGSVDFVFVDADHSYECVKADLAAWWPKVRPGGFFCGHDYGVYGDATGDWGVSRAVNELAAAEGREIQLGLDGTWKIVR